MALPPSMDFAHPIERGGNSSPSEAGSMDVQRSRPVTETNRGFWQAADFMRRDDLTVTAKVLYCKIVDFSNGYGCRVPQAELADMLGVSKNTINNTIRDLVEKKLITKGTHGSLIPQTGIPISVIEPPKIGTPDPNIGIGESEESIPKIGIPIPKIEQQIPKIGTPSKHEEQEHELSLADADASAGEQAEKPKGKKPRKPKAPKPDKSELEKQQDIWLRRLFDAHPNPNGHYKCWNLFRKLVKSEIDWVMCWIAHKDCLASDEWTRYVDQGRPEMCGELITWLGTKPWVHQAGEYKQRALTAIQKRKEQDARLAIERELTKDSLFQTAGVAQ